MKTTLGRTVILVEDYDEAYAFYHKNFLCHKIYDQTMPGGQRYLHIAFSEQDNSGIWFLKAESGKEHQKTGHQTGGQPTLVIYTDDAEGLYQHLVDNKVTILEELVSSPESKFFHSLDLYGNRLVVVELIEQKP